MQVYQLLYVIDGFGYTYIHLCDLYGQLEILQFLVDYFKQCCRFILK